ncbi:MAG: cold shock domain-containing protein [Bacteroidales bacterium]|nr:cold shock domain-containing protein [Bacteroidales bacterium]
MGRSQETYNKKEVRTKKEKKRKDKEMKRQAKKETGKNSMDNMIAYVDENGMITSTPPELKKNEIKAEDIEISTAKKTKGKPDPIRKGTLTFFNESKGFGFIKDSETRESIFVHVNNILEEVKEGNLLEFEIEKGKKGLTAVNVKRSK